MSRQEAAPEMMRFLFTQPKTPHLPPLTRHTTHHSMGNRSSAYPADHLASTRGGASSSSASARTTSRGSSSSGSGHQGHLHRGSSSSSSAGYSRPQDQTTCPQCARVLLIPPNAPLFRCPCGVLFRTETLQQEQRHRGSLLERTGNGLLGPDGLMGRAVICRRCRRLSMLPQDGSGGAGSIAVCRCGSPALPLNDMVMSLLAEGELGLLAGGRNGLLRRGEMEGASKDLIDVLPTCKFSAAAAARAASARGSVTESAAPVSSTRKGEKEVEEEEEEQGEGMEKGLSAAAAAATDAAWFSCLPAAEGGEAAAAAAAPLVPEKGKESGGGGCCTSSKRVAKERSCCPGEGKAAESVEEIPAVISKQLDSHNDDLSCRICFEDYVDGDELRVLPCFHRFHTGCSFDWLSRKKTCPLCMTSIDVIMRRPEDLMAGEGEGETCG